MFSIKTAFASATLTFSATVTLALSSISSPIADGELAKEGDFPFVVSIGLLVNDCAAHKCSGSLLDATTVLTAAHCFRTDDVQMFRVRAGSMVSGCLSALLQS
jgi:secreted trypsin-like serine protease